MDYDVKDTDVLKFLTGVIWAQLPIVAIAAWLAGNSLIVPCAISAVFGAAGAAALRMADDLRKPLVGVALIGQPIALTAALAAHPWQLDAHMTFFAALAVLGPPSTT